MFLYNFVRINIFWLKALEVVRLFKKIYICCENYKLIEWMDSCRLCPMIHLLLTSFSWGYLLLTGFYLHIEYIGKKSPIGPSIGWPHVIHLRNRSCTLQFKWENFNAFFSKLGFFTKEDHNIFKNESTDFIEIYIARHTNSCLIEEFFCQIFF